MADPQTMQAIQGLQTRMSQLDREIAALKQGQSGRSDIQQGAVYGYHLTPEIVGSGMVLTNDQVAANVDDTTIEIASNALQVKDGSITPAKLSIEPSRIVWATTPQTGYSATGVAASVAFADRTCGLTPTAGATMTAVILKMTVQITADSGPPDGSTCHLDVRKNGYTGGVQPALHFSFYDNYRTAIVVVGTDANKVYERSFTWGGNTANARYTLKIEELGHIEEY